MRALAVAATSACLAVAATFLAADGAAAPTPREVGPLPFLPSVARVRVGITKDRVVVTHAITLPRGEWRSGDLDLYVAYGAPGAPIALDAHVLRVADGDLEAREGVSGEVVPYERVASRPPNVHALIGRSRMAGVVLHVREAAFRAAAADGMAELRVRALYPMPAEETDAGREVRVRLGTPGGSPLTLARVQVLAVDREVTVARAEARLCGPDAETRPLAVTVTPKPAKPTASALDALAAPIAPVLSVRHTSDDLCVRVWTTPSPPPGQSVQSAPNAPEPLKSSSTAPGRPGT